MLRAEKDHSSDGFLEWVMNGNRNRPFSRRPHTDGPTRFGIMGNHRLSHHADRARRLHGVGIPAYGLRKGRGAAALNPGATDRLQSGRGGPALSAARSKQCVSSACRLTLATKTGRRRFCCSAIKSRSCRSRLVATPPHTTRCVSPDEGLPSLVCIAAFHRLEDCPI